jgi:hypothetical protein
MGQNHTHFLSTSDLIGPQWTFLAEHCARTDISWQTISGLAQNPVERWSGRRNLGRWRAAVQAATAAKRHKGTILVSHLPRMAAVPQIAFAFNFTTLPEGWRRDYLGRALRGVAEFVVFSRFEQSLYAEMLDIDPARLRYLPWAMDRPEVGPEPGHLTGLPPEVTGQGYLCAIGGEGRDYAVLARLMTRRPQDHLVIVARPYSLSGISFPQNVTVLQNLPAPQTWAIAATSRGMILPLRDSRTACGHITIVAAQKLGIPLAISRSIGVADYVEEGRTAALFDPADDAGLARILEAWQDDPALCTRMAEAARAQAESRSDLGAWVDYFVAARTRLNGAPG